MGAPPAANPHLARIARYQPGRSAEAVMAEHGLDSAVKLASNECAFGPLPGVAEAVASAVATANRYADHTATAAAEAFAEVVGVPRERVTVGPGTVGLLEQLALAYTRPGDEVLFPWPSFIAYPQFTQLTGATPVTVALRRHTFDVDALLGAVTERTRAVLIATPNNPVPTALRAAALEQLVAGLPERCLVVLDAAYQEFVTGADVPDPLALFGDRPNVVVLRTLSKAYGLAGLRAGFLVADPEVVDAVDATLIPFVVTGAAQAAAVAALAQREEVARRASLVVAERERVAQALRRRGLGTPDSQANFVWLPAGRRAAPLAVALERQGVVTRPFHDHGVRVTTGFPEENDRFIAALDDVLAESPDLAASWALPTGARAEATAVHLDRLDVAVERLRTHLVTEHRGLTRPVPGEEERWADADVWAHLAEFGDYWLAQLHHVLAAPSSEPVPFGRTRHDRGRIAAIAAGRSTPAAAHLAAVERAADRLRALLCELTEGEWGRVGLHPTLGAIDVDRQLDEFHIGHYEQHADQLDELTEARAGA
jgi:histidinol-phosphate aminotransferase